MEKNKDVEKFTQGIRKETFSNNYPVSTDLTKQHQQFEEMFSKWEWQFEVWKRNNANNPDKVYVNQYIDDMNKMKQRLLERRRTLNEKVEQEQSAYQASYSPYFEPMTNKYAQK